jgi:predicted phosphatase
MHLVYFSISQANFNHLFSSGIIEGQCLKMIIAIWIRLKLIFFKDAKKNQKITPGKILFTAKKKHIATTFNYWGCLSRYKYLSGTIDVIALKSTSSYRFPFNFISFAS